MLKVMPMVGSVRPSVEKYKQRKVFGFMKKIKNTRISPILKLTIQEVYAVDESGADLQKKGPIIAKLGTRSVNMNLSIANGVLWKGAEMNRQLVLQKAFRYGRRRRVRLSI